MAKCRTSQRCPLGQEAESFFYFIFLYTHVVKKKKKKRKMGTEAELERDNRPERFPLRFWVKNSICFNWAWGGGSKNLAFLSHLIVSLFFLLRQVSLLAHYGLKKRKRLFSTTKSSARSVDVSLHKLEVRRQQKVTRETTK